MWVPKTGTQKVTGNLTSPLTAQLVTGAATQCNSQFSLLLPDLRLQLSRRTGRGCIKSSLLKKFGLLIQWERGKKVKRRTLRNG